MGRCGIRGVGRGAAGAPGWAGLGLRGGRRRPFPHQWGLPRVLRGHWLMAGRLCEAREALPLSVESAALCSDAGWGGAGAGDGDRGVEELPPPARPAVPGRGRGVSGLIQVLCAQSLGSGGRGDVCVYRTVISEPPQM